MTTLSDKEKALGSTLFSAEKNAVGVDVGSMYASVAVLDSDKNIVRHLYRQHQGNVVDTVQGLLDELNVRAIERVAKTGSGSEQVADIGPLLDPVVALLYGARHLHPDVRNVIYIGAGSFHLIHTNDEGDYLRHTSNTACASGTGAFLDQQALRIEKTPEEFHELAACASCTPSVATRCAVFAKTDIIHLQQVGFGPGDIAAGICKGMADSTLDVLLKGKKIEGKTMIVGGVARNDEILKHIEERLGFDTVRIEHPELTGAIGAALYAQEAGASVDFPWTIGRAELGIDTRLRRPALALEKSDYPDFDSFHFSINDDNTEIALPEEPAKKQYDVAIGIDIGSTSTKGVVTDTDGKPLITIYRKTGGDPIHATQLLLKAITEAAEMFDLELTVKGVGTTGSGRKLIKKVIAADIEMNEITAHARAAIHLDSKVDTILEIGGQDAKFTQLSDGVVYNSVMNHVCAAGTGSFIEEQAKKLDISLWDYGDNVIGVAPPRTSDRCTVFMERDLDTLLSQGWSKKEVAASVLYSVCDNYLNKVVAGQYIGDQVYFQGATARNKALVAAFEQTLGKPITVSPYCHLTGALGMALLLVDQKNETTKFRGLDFADTKIETTTETCELCRNNCEVTVVDIDGDRVGWGMKCGREYDDLNMKKIETPTYDLFRMRQKMLHLSAGRNPSEPKFSVGMPMSLTSHGYLPLWGTFLRQLGGKIVFSKPTSDATRKRGLQLTQASFCSPVIFSHGHVAELAQTDTDFIFLPHMIHAPDREVEKDSQFCPYVQSHPSVIKSSSALNGYKGKVVSPSVLLNMPTKVIARELHRELEGACDVSFRQVHRALKVGLAAQEEFRTTMLEEGEKAVAELEAKNEMGIVIFGRPYNVFDPGVNVNLAEKIAAMGVTVIPLDCMAEGEADARWDNMYWNYGQVILRVARRVVQSNNLFGIYFSNFSCGPDSYIQTYFKTMMEERRKPFLAVQFDAHGADAGYVTRVEAALESFRAWTPEERELKLSVPVSMAAERKRLIFVPPLDPIGAPLFAAAFEADGFRAEVLEETEETLDIGYKHVNGGECAPCPSTIGSFIKTVEERGLKPDEVTLFMPRAEGPCRFGQYACLDRVILQKKGWEDVNIISPSARNAYCGLSTRLQMNMHRGIVLGDIITKMLLKTRPYEEVEGVCDLLVQESIKLIREGFCANEDLRPRLEQIVGEFQKVVTVPSNRPKVGIVGEIYVRNSKFLNQDAIGWIERYGGEAVRTSIGEWVLYTSYLMLNRPQKARFQPINRLKNLYIDHLYHSIESEYYNIAMPMIHDRLEPPIDKLIERGREYFPLEFEGEAILTIGRTLCFIEDEGVDAVVNLSPNFCMPGTTTTSMLAKIEEDTGVPVICNFYDGSGEPNKVLRPHLHCLTRRRQAEQPAGKVKSPK